MPTCANSPKHVFSRWEYWPVDLYADVLAGWRAIANGDAETALREFKSSANRGEIEAQLALGHVYESSTVVKQDYTEAMKWYRLASAQGSGEASVVIAGLYEDGLGVSPDPATANKWYELGARQGYDQQELTVECAHLQPATGGLTIRNLDGSDARLSVVQLKALQSAGVTGTLTLSGGGTRSRKGPKARALIVLRKQVTSEDRLRQPRHTEVVYVQQENRDWQLFPKDASMLKRLMVLSPQPEMPENTLVAVQDVDGSSTGGGCAMWK